MGGETNTLYLWDLHTVSVGGRRGEGRSRGEKGGREERGGRREGREERGGRREGREGEGRRERREGGRGEEGKEGGRRGIGNEGGGGREWREGEGEGRLFIDLQSSIHSSTFPCSLSSPLPPPVQSPPQIKAQLPSNATACYALAVSTDGKVCDVTTNCMSHVVVHAYNLG